MYRHISKGGWTLSDQDQGWQVSDCTAEAAKVIKLVNKLAKVFTRFLPQLNFYFFVLVVLHVAFHDAT